MMTDKLVYTPQEAADALNLCLNTMYALLREKRIRSIRYGRKHLIPASELSRVLESEELKA